MRPTSVPLWRHRQMPVGCIASFVSEPKARHPNIRRNVIAQAGLPAIKESCGLSTSDCKYPDGLTLIPWQEGKPLCWNVPVACSLASCCVQTACGTASAVVEMSAECKSSKYQALEGQCVFMPLTSEILGLLTRDTPLLSRPWLEKSCTFLVMTVKSLFIYQRISVSLQFCSS